MIKEVLERRFFASELDESLLGEKVNVAGWVEDIRPLGALIFLTVRDASGVVQAVFGKSNTPQDVFTTASSVARQSIVVIHGTVKESKAKDMRVEIQSDSIEILSLATHPLPIDPTGRVDSSLDLRLDSRALDLRNPSKAAIFKIKHTALQSIRKTLIDEKCIEVNTPKIIGQAVEGGATLFSLDYFGKEAFLAQSPQLYKEQLTLSLGRVFEISTYFRAEKSHTRRHINEFVSVDLEAAFSYKDDVMVMLEKVATKAIEDVLKNCQDELQILNRDIVVPRIPFDKITYSEAIEELAESGLRMNFGEDLDTKALRKLGKRHKGFYFIVDWPTKLKPFYIETKEGNYEISESFDLMYDYIELASGGTRVSDKEKLERRLSDSGLDTKKFSDHLKAFTWGMPPHAGWGLGLDRFIMVLTGMRNIREVVLYPRDRFRLNP
ncbi:MAG: aspartate--tRNA(Asn) ligase [Candidatus Methylarchaceae archaeon HK01M]|nr:aspartate--tRNA(Asn) ligase [Candidatus Methylarchaceae archaeon HK01M]